MTTQSQTLARYEVQTYLGHSWLAASGTDDLDVARGHLSGLGDPDARIWDTLEGRAVS